MSAVKDTSLKEKYNAAKTIAGFGILAIHLFAQIDLSLLEDDPALMSEIEEMLDNWNSVDVHDAIELLELDV